MTERINGEYEVTLHIEDPRVESPMVVKLGQLTVSFDEGTTEGSNLGIREDFRLFEQIINYFPPEEPAKGALVPLVFCGMLATLFLYFLGQIFGNGSNLKNMSFGGMLFSLNYLAIMGVIVAFWIEINLVNTLWILAALTPVTLFTMNLGLTPENCHIPDFFLKTSASKQKNQ
mmetsp:Transcript_17492/g.29448  ORF Transcript_17492/g.29448 Transcript_17492/m.29448 type:complete len:173 (+) Transcript_17492:1693-2211(+)